MKKIIFIHNHSNGMEDFINHLVLPSDKISEVSFYLPVQDFVPDKEADFIIHRGIDDEDELEHWIKFVRFNDGPVVIVTSGIIRPHRFLKHIRPFHGQFSWSLYSFDTSSHYRIPATYPLVSN